VARRALEKHIRLNALTGNVEIVATAVGSTSGESILFATEADGMSRLGAPNQAIAGRTSEIPVPVVSLDDYVATHALEPDVLLVDIEGLRFKPFRGRGT